MSCVVTPPDLASSERRLDSVAVDIQVPPTPDATHLTRLPPQRRDYSRLPIRVFVVGLPAAGERPAIVLPKGPPLVTDFTPRRLGLNDGAKDQFVRVVFPRQALRAGADIVAERTAVTDSGDRITSQTRCRLTASDVAVWR